MWKGVAANLADALITAPDLPGHGRSAGFEEGRDVHDQATDAIRPLVRDGMHLVGHSFGATVALRLALESPARVTSVTLIEPVFFAAAKDSPKRAAHRIEEEAVFEAFESGDHLGAAKAFNRLWGGGSPWDSLPAPVQAGMTKGMSFVAGTEPSLWRDCHGLLEQGRLEALEAPVRLVRGARTVPIIADVHAGLMDRLPNASEAVIPGAGHMLVMTHAKEVAEAILA